MKYLIALLLLTGCQISPRKVISAGEVLRQERSACVSKFLGENVAPQSAMKLCGWVFVRAGDDFKDEK